ncbi:MAG TPA: hypothetical protein VF796_01795 [Humisphaera sp.]
MNLRVVPAGANRSHGRRALSAVRLAAVLLTAICSTHASGQGAESDKPARRSDVPPPLSYSVSWVGNTFPGGDAGWVPQDVQDIFVTSDGTVYTTVGWEEHRGNIAAFRDGKWVQQTAHWRRGGIDRLVGESIAANDKYVFFATGTAAPGERDGKIMGTSLARRDRRDVADRKLEQRVAVGVRLNGVAATADRVFAAGEDGRVRVYDAELRPLGEWPAPAPGEMAADARGRLWIVDTQAHVVRCFDAAGKALPQVVRFDQEVVPVDVAVTPAGKLLVADGGVNRQVLVYRNLDGEPERERTLGEKGGVFAGPTRGAFADRRFICPVGVGGDAQGNVYVACGPYAKTHGGTAVIQGYGPDDRLNWRVMSTEWLDTVDVDRGADGGVLFGSRYRYTLDLSRPAGQQWTLAAVTLDPDRYPDDPRASSAAVGGVWHRRIGGRSYLFMPDMNGGGVSVFRFDPQRQGEVAIPCAQVGTKELWCDADGNGRRDAGETADNPTAETRGWYVDPNGTIWQATGRKGIFAYPVSGFDAHGTPRYRVEARKQWPMPAPFTELRRIAYDAQADVMYLAGSTAEARAEHWKPMGPNLARFDRWSEKPVTAWHTELAHEKAKGGHESYEPFDFAVEGDYVFVVYAGRLPSQNLPTGTVMVFDKRDRRYVSAMHPPGTRTGAVPMDALQDMVHSLNVYRRGDGEYLIFIEDDGYTKNVMYRWRP